ncbi:NAD(P)H-dependent glycerol-3-phosphate dehydrogenase [Metamycoplasma equirhinis]|uniref:Glycerol-3-phosphate dehydrogenase [NAD(P)+] n=1 Tax=Metamycoplasma equirhinis TaxID=92402 RepID=A0ABZ0PBJ1_9BACT|nr:NAD(P)H-dependent glycerol-3-phosphate dehydrogenase [Metamycoplasma equirhinis]TPD98183.1 NAD(P)H-dependent glycerol-3-phosphate dehydrogenase [Metamycoplasma equirhinis]WPB54225.1 NAD(P)H-dependent glycerol-3-phosphate dehydrogenase [Metamycoplasma equirhinis]BDX52669.1 glycerol-3-phosphate dehydrogenase [NAD(P)+] [Metamycoplasma equirhinis]
MAKILVLGSGGMGTACASVLVNNGHDVTIYGIEEAELNDLTSGKNLKYFPDVFDLPKFKVSNNILSSLENVEYVLFAIPTKFISEVFKKVISNLSNKAVIINVAKGFWPGTNFSVHEQMITLTKENQFVKGIVSLIGPSFAIDIVKKNITAISAVSYDIELASEIQKIFSNDSFRVYSQLDVKGAEIGSIFKNIIAIASGMAEGLGYSTNTQVAIITRGINEMKLYNNLKGGKEETIYGLTGLGDLILTALSSKSRNYTFGKNFFDKNFDSSKITIEGLKSIEVIYNEFIKNKILKLPIVEALYKIIYLKLDVHDVIKSLMTRPLKKE